jgi:two-component system, chemotaxis family, sensor kinase CheA
MSDEIVREFLVEGNENLDALDRELVQLEKDPRNHATLASVFRTIHTIKGTCGFLGFTKLESVAHVGENLLSRLRDGEILLNPQIATALLKMVDAVRQMMQSIEVTGNEGERQDEDLIKLLATIHLGASAADSDEQPKSGSASPTVQKSPTGETRRSSSTASASESTANASQPTPSSKTKSKKVQAETKPSAAETEKNPSTEEIEAGQTQQSTRPVVSESSIRVDVFLLDKLMNLVGELVLARNQILQFSNGAEDASIVAPSQRLNLITTELQEGVMKTRMQPIGNIWSKFPRTVRDVATACGKQVRIEMFGQETELDKTIIEAIKDPLTHLVRNSVDHGIERPEVRAAAGKPAEGCVTLRAYHEGGQVNIEISDDGAGLDQDKIKRKALERGLLTAEKLAQMGEREILNLIFLPGFSTAEKITNVSGRGVGMDVVKTNIERIGGTVDIQSTSGIGTTVKTKIPLTLAIIPGLVVRVREKRFVIPQVSLVELVRIDGDASRTGIEMVHGAPVYRLRGRLLPLIYLDRELNIAKKSAESDADEVKNMVVLQADGRQFGLIVDEIRDTEEIVVKPLDRRLKGLKTFAGATIMGDGVVALILDVLGLAQRAGVVSETHDRAAWAAGAEEKETVSDKQTFLVFAGPDDARMAVPLGALARLEVFPASQVEDSGTESVIQYRGKILPLVYLKAVLEERRKRPRHGQSEMVAADPQSVQVLVCNHDGKAVGLVVEDILDIIEDRADVKTPATRAGVLYAAVIENRVTEILDLEVVLKSAFSTGEREEEHVKVGG